jgi:hypothetical protein
VTFLMLFVVGGFTSLHAQDETRGLKPDEAGIVTNPGRKQTRQVTFRTSHRFTRRPIPKGMTNAQLGLTIWRVDHGQSKGIEQVGQEQTLERLDTNSPYREGDTIRLRIESPTSGYLYIIDQEQYADGAYSPPMLVFPTLRTRKGDNLIQPWKPIDIPAYPAVWQFVGLKPKEGETRKVQSAEVLTIIISPQELIDRVRITDKPLALKAGEFAGWRTKWQGKIQQFDMENTVGQTGKTKGIEQQGDEVTDGEMLDAQTTFLTTIKSGNPLLVTIPLRFRSGH